MLPDGKDQTRKQREMGVARLAEPSWKSPYTQLSTHSALPPLPTPFLGCLLWVPFTTPNAISPRDFLWELPVWTQILSKGWCSALAVSGDHRLNCEEIYSSVKTTFQPSQQHLLGLFSRACETSFLSDKMLFIPHAHHAPGLGRRVRQVMQRRTRRL